MNNPTEFGVIGALVLVVVTLLAFLWKWRKGEFREAALNRKWVQNEMHEITRALADFSNSQQETVGVLSALKDSVREVSHEALVLIQRVVDKCGGPK